MGEIVTPRRRTSPSGEVLHFAALKCFAVAQAGGEHAREVGFAAQDFLVGAVAQRRMPKAFRRRDWSEPIAPVALTRSKPGGHVARDFFGEAFGFLGAFLREQVQSREFLFLRAQLFDHALHGGGHECRGIVDAGLRVRPVVCVTGDPAAQNFRMSIDSHDTATSRIRTPARSR